MFRYHRPATASDQHGLCDTAIRYGARLIGNPVALLDILQSKGQGRGGSGVAGSTGLVE